MVQVVDVEVAKIRGDVYSQRLEVEGDRLDELVGSIRRVGVLVPIIVASDGDGFVLIAGHRRVAACKRVGLLTVPGIVRSGQDAEMVEVAFAENFFRQDLSAIEQAAAIKDCIDRGIMTFEQVAAGFRRSPEWAKRQVALLGWPADVLEAIHFGRISVSAASNIACVEEANYREFLLRCAVDNGATARTTAAWLQQWEAGRPPEQAVTAEPVPAGSGRVPAVPQAPCIRCSGVFRSDELSHVPLCSGCIRKIQGIGREG